MVIVPDFGWVPGVSLFSTFIASAAVVDYVLMLTVNNVVTCFTVKVSFMVVGFLLTFAVLLYVSYKYWSLYVYCTLDKYPPPRPKEKQQVQSSIK